MKEVGRNQRQWRIRPAETLAEYSRAWDELNRLGPNSPLLSGRFLMTALRAFGTGEEKLALLGNPARPDGMAVLRERRRGVWETFQPAQAPLGFWLNRPGIDLDAALRALNGALPGVSLVVGITQQDPDLLPRPRPTPHLQTLDYIDTARIRVAGDFDAFWEQRGKNLRQNMRKVRNKLDRAGLSARLLSISDPAEVAQAITDYGRMESAGWKSRDGTAVHPDNRQGRFYRELLEEHCREGLGRIVQLLFNDRVVAMDLCIEGDGVIVILKTTYDETAAEYSPAMLMHQELFRELYATGAFQRIEFYGKVMDWHLRWTEDKRTMYHINAYRWAWLKRLLAPRPTTSPKFDE
jgi:CelD/BcsL family acetyltransferase involved in cellulose biosynthesis